MPVETRDAVDKPAGSEPAVRGRFAYAHPNRSLAMDMLRGVAILLVLGRHYVVPPEGLGVLQPLAGSWTTIGWAGVDLFFVVSGFLVSGLIFAEYRQRAHLDIRRFVIRRGFKIWPPYLAYVAVVALWLGWQLRGDGGAVWAALWPNVFHVQNYFHTPRVHTWSLAVEEHFYLAAAIVFWWLLARRNAIALLRHLPACIVTCVAGLAVARHVGFVQKGPAELNLYATHLRFDGLLIGTLLAYLTHFSPGSLARLVRYPVTLMGVGIALAAPTLIASPEASAWSAGVGLTGVYVGFALCMLGWLNLANVHAFGRRLLQWRASAVLGHIGFFSYSIYLWHVDLAQTPVRKALQWLGASEVSPALLWLCANVVYVVLAVLTGMLLARILEIPSLALRDRLFPSAVKSSARVAHTPAPETPTPPASVAVRGRVSGEVSV